jgi:hypothetical protein
MCAPEVDVEATERDGYRCAVPGCTSRPSCIQTGKPTARISSRALLFSTTPGRIR